MCEDYSTFMAPSGSVRADRAITEDTESMSFYFFTILLTLVVENMYGEFNNLIPFFPPTKFVSKFEHLLILYVIWQFITPGYETFYAEFRAC